ncbi:MAG: DUF1266 domain-containing protein [Bacteroidales bacterium]|nr:DUF1266 domain-containing protein [Bacteroidales bacterium]MCM1416548.1 DUF1266 domain-containing protein [bacterium]MCM1424853.1 DUF1266 domain-containing protein [bacterium]
MKRFWKLTAVFIVSALLLAGCGAAGNEEESAARDTAAESTENAGNTDVVPAAEQAEDTDKAAAPEETAEDADRTAAAEEPAETEETKPITMAGLMKESRGGQVEELPETILWFNATYASLTYSNGWNWRLVGGLEPTEDNRELSKELLEGSWSVTDRASALETTARLLKDGHRQKCIDYTKEMEEWGLLDLDEEAFVEQIVLQEDVGSEIGRYAVAYLMHRAGIEPEYIAAWDLCRVNQLYADYYICGYMSYEEAMDASLANSLNLQELYGSWDEMMEAYLLGYQFWQGEPTAAFMGDTYDFDSPTQERRHYYEMLQELEDGPYTLDWDMKLEKSW